MPSLWGNASFSQGSTDVAVRIDQNTLLLDNLYFVGMSLDTLQVDTLTYEDGVGVYANARTQINNALGVTTMFAVGTSSVTLTGRTTLAATSIAGALTTPAQPGITSVGVLTSLTVSPGLVTCTLGPGPQPNISSINSLTISTSLSVTGTVALSGIIHMNGVLADTTVINQGSYVVWNSNEFGQGRTEFVNKSGAGPGGFAFWNSTGDNSTYATGKTILARILPDQCIFNTLVSPAAGITLPDVAAHLTTSGSLYRLGGTLHLASTGFLQLRSGTSGNVRFAPASGKIYHGNNNSEVPVTVFGTFVVTSQIGTALIYTTTVSLTIPLNVANNTTVCVCNGDFAANTSFFPLSGTLQSGTLTVFARGNNTSTARINYSITYIP